MSLNGVAETPATVEAELNYLVPTTERPRRFAYDPPPDAARTTARTAPVRVRIRDGRPIAGVLTLDRHGFTLIRHRSAVRDFYDDAEVKAVYYAEAIHILRRLTGASRIHVFDHTIVQSTAGTAGRRDGVRPPVGRVHVDHTARSGPQRVRELMPTDAQELLRGRVQVIKLWRSVRGPLLDRPLAVCDARSVDPLDLVPTDLIDRERSGETYSVTYRPSHRWYYFSGMDRDEVLLLKCFDSALDGRARFAPHSAFADPTTPYDAPLRESIALRTLVFHPAH